MNPVHLEKKLNRPIVSILFSVIIGIFVYSVSNKSLLGAVIIAASFLILSIIFFSKEYIFILILFFLISMINTFVYFNLDLKKQKAFTVRVIAKNKSYSLGNVSGRRVKIEGLEERIESGEKCVVNGIFKKKTDFDKGIIGTIYVDSTLGEQKDFIFRLKNISKDYFEKLKCEVGDEDSALISSTTLGYTEALTKEQNNDMVRLGIVHVISVSGFHIALIFLILEKFVPLKFSIGISFIYVLLTGASPPTMRAFFMILVLKLSKRLFKNYDGITAVSLSALLLILYKPYNLFDIGFVLSHLATFGIVSMYKPFLRVFYRLPKKLNESISICFAAQIFTVPYLALTIKDFSLNFLLGNIVVLPLFTPLIIVGNIDLVFMWNDFLFALISKSFYPIMLCIKGALRVTEGISIGNIYLNESFFYGYSIILMCFYMYSKGFKNFKKLSYLVLIYMIVSNYSFYTKITICEEKWNKGIVVEKGFERVLITNCSNEYFINKIKKQYCIYNVEQIKFDYGMKLSGNEKLMVNKALKEAYIIFTENKDNNTKPIYYDIIGMNEEGKNIIRIINGKLFTSDF